MSNCTTKRMKKGGVVSRGTRRGMRKATKGGKYNK